MIQHEIYGVVEGMTLIRTWSDDGVMIRQDETGEVYAEAIDPEFMNRIYTETDIPIVTEEFPDPGTDPLPEIVEPPEEGGEDLEELGVPEEDPTEPEEGGTGSTIPIKPSKKY